MRNNINRVMLAESYKYSQPLQYPKNTTYMFNYMEARSGDSPVVVFTGVQYVLRKYFSEPIRQWEVNEAYEFAQIHGEPFDKEGWDYIVQELGGRLPVRIRAVKEGSVIPIRNVLMTMESTDEKVFWIPGFMETVMMKLWYPTAVATKAYGVRKMIEKYLTETGTQEALDFKYHNFGDRGATSVESASIAGIAHLTQFLGTDNFNALRDAKRYYNDPCAGYSIPASEHSTVTSWGREGRFEMYDTYIETFKNRPVVACVMDSYDIYEDVRYVTSGAFKEKIESDDYPLFVIRPDSGDPVKVIRRLLEIMEENGVKHTINNKGYKVFNKYTFIWGDGISPEVIDRILLEVVSNGYSADIISFGSGGDLVQNVNRDTHGFAIKCSAVTINGEVRDVFKDPITDPGKISKKGVLELMKVLDGSYYVTVPRTPSTVDNSELITVFENGNIKINDTLDQIRARSR